MNAFAVQVAGLICALHRKFLWVTCAWRWPLLKRGGKGTGRLWECQADWRAASVFRVA